MSDLFGNLNSIQYPDVVMNQGPLPTIGRLPTPLHDTPDSRINYGSALLGDITPYAYGEPGYLSSQNSYLHIPHRVQKVIPLLHLPEPSGKTTFTLSHGVDDSDLVFVLRLDKNSIFCKGTRSGRPLGTIIDTLINLPTFNYILAGIQINMSTDPDGNNHLWKEFLLNLRPMNDAPDRDYNVNKLNLEDIMHIVKNCVRPFGIMRGSEKQGGQSEVTLSAVNWPVPFIGTLVVDGKESNVVNIWHFHDISAGDDLVLRLDVMPVKTYTLNHYYKKFERKTFDLRDRVCVWQVLPDVLNYDLNESDYLDVLHPKLEQLPLENRFELQSLNIGKFYNMNSVGTNRNAATFAVEIPVIRALGNNRHIFLTWHQLGYWHIAKSMVMMRKYGHSEYYNDDMANQLKTNHLELTFQPVFCGVAEILSNEAAFVTDQVHNMTHVGGAVEVEEVWPKEVSKDFLMPVIEEAGEERPRAKKSKRGEKTISGSILKLNGDAEPASMSIL